MTTSNNRAACPASYVALRSAFENSSPHVKTLIAAPIGFWHNGCVCGQRPSRCHLTVRMANVVHIPVAIQDPNRGDIPQLGLTPNSTKAPIKRNAAICTLDSVVVSRRRLAPAAAVIPIIITICVPNLGIGAG